MKRDAKPFLRNALLITAATVIIALLMNEWGAAQIIIIALLAVISAGQWAMFIFMRK